MDYRKQHLESAINQAQSAIITYTDRIAECEELIVEFTKLNNSIVVDTYRDWSKAWSDKVIYFQARLIELQCDYLREYGEG